MNTLLSMKGKMSKEERRHLDDARRENKFVTTFPRRFRVFLQYVLLPGLTSLGTPVGFSSKEYSSHCNMVIALESHNKSQVLE